MADFLRETASSPIFFVAMMMDMLYYLFHKKTYLIRYPLGKRIYVWNPAALISRRERQITSKNPAQGLRQNKKEARVRILHLLGPGPPISFTESVCLPASVCVCACVYVVCVVPVCLRARVCVRAQPSIYIQQAKPDTTQPISNKVV